MRNLNHTLHVMTSQTLSQFIVPEERRIKARGVESVTGVDLGPVSERKVLVLVSWRKISKLVT